MGLSISINEAAAFNVTVAIPGPQGPAGATGPQGPQGDPGVGVPANGLTGQILAKASNTSYDTSWVNITDVSAVWGQITGTLANQLDLSQALALKADLASPTFTGVPAAPTAPTLTSTTQLATTAFVQQELAAGTAVAKNLEVYVRNQTGDTLAAGAIVYINGSTGNRPTVTKAQANNDANSAQTFGFVKESIADNGFGYVIVRGELENVNTNGLTEGAQLYLSPTTPGTWTTTKPSAPQHMVYVGIVVRAHPTQGIILVAIQNGLELEELHNVKITTPTTGQVLKYDAVQQLWVNGTDSSGVAWGSITGSITAQTDLQNSLGLKADLTGAVFTGNITTVYGTQYVLIDPITPIVTVTDGVTAVNVASNGITFPDFTVQTTAYTGTSATSWGSITGTLSAQTDLANALSAKYDATNPAGYITSSALSGYLLSSTAASTYYPLTNPSGYITSSALTGYAQLSGATFTGKINLPTRTAGGTSYLNLGAITDNVTPPSTLVEGDIFFIDSDSTVGASNVRLVYTAKNFSGVLTNYSVAVLQNANFFTQPNTISCTHGTNAALTLTQNGNGGGVRLTNNGTGDSLYIDNGTPDVAFTVNTNGRVGVGVAPDTTAAISIDAGGIKFNDGTFQTTAAGAAWTQGEIYAHSAGAAITSNCHTFALVSSPGQLDISFSYNNPSVLAGLASSVGSITIYGNDQGGFYDSFSGGASINGSGSFTNSQSMLNPPGPGVVYDVYLQFSPAGGTTNATYYVGAITVS
jgi:ribosomal protein L35AE/L33A